MSYQNLKAELARKGIARRELAPIFKDREATVYDRLNGKTSMTVEEIIAIRNMFLPNLTLDYLLEEEIDNFATIKNRGCF